MNQTTTGIELEAALDAAAPTQELWLAGHAAYHTSLLTDPDKQTAYYAALDAAAPDKESWIAGRDMLVLNDVLLLPQTKRFSIPEKHKSMFKKGNSHWSTQVWPVRLFRALFYGIGVLAFLLFQPLVFASWNTAYGVGLGTFYSIVSFVLWLLAAAVLGQLLLNVIHKKNHPTPSTMS